MHRLQRLFFVMAVALLAACAPGASPVLPETPTPTLIPTLPPVAPPTATAEAQPEPPPTATPMAEPAAAPALDLATLNGPFGGGWLWDAYAANGDAGFQMDGSLSYSVVFLDETSLYVTSDCNSVILSYQASGSDIGIEPTTDELQECADGSRSRQFLDLLAQSASLSVVDSELEITLQEGAGILHFSAYDPLAEYRVESWDAAAQEFLQRCGAPGGVLLVDGPEGRLLQAYGVASLEDDRPVRPDDLFEIGSNSKSFTAVLALQLQEEGIWSLDDPLSRWLPEAAAALPNGDAVTLRHLAANTSGIWDYADPLIGAAIENNDLEQGYTPQELIDYVVENGEPLFAPGEGASYSSTNFVLLGMAIEAATGEALADLYQERIFEPLGMESSYLLAGVPEAGTIVDGYYDGGAGGLMKTTAWNASQGWAAGGIVSTAADMAAFAQALDRGTLFRSLESSLELTAFGDEPVLPFLGYGLGVGRFLDEPFAWGHGGQTAGFQTLYLNFSLNQTYLVLLTNSASCRVFDFLTYVQASSQLLPDPLALLGLILPSFPLAEPDYTHKRPRSLEPFQEALSALAQEEGGELDDLILGKTIPELQQAMDAGQLSSQGLVTYYVSRIVRYDLDRLNSVMELNPEALDIARALDEERSAGSLRGPLHGIPVLVKDNIATGDQMHTTAGAYALGEWQADRDAFLVQRLRDAGAVILGKANLSEWANYTDPSMPSGFSTLGGQTRHPYGPFDPLGSSTGSAVAVAANLTTVSVGTETQGSIIMPAAVNGVVAVKTSRGLVSRDYIIPLVDWMDVPGPMGRTVTDVAILLTAMTGADEKDPAAAAAASLAGTDFSQYAAPDVAMGKRVAIFITSDETVDAMIEQLGFSDEAAQSQRQAIADANAANRQFGQILADAGLEVVEVDSSEAPAAPSPMSALEYGFRDSVDRFLKALGERAPLASLAEVASVNAEDPQNRVPYGQGYITGSIDTAITAEEYAQILQENQESARAGLRNVFDTYDVDVLLVGLSQAYAAAGYPAITVPNGLNSTGEPVGLTFIGDFLGEPDLIAVAYAYEQATLARVEPDLEAAVAEIDAMVAENAGSELTPPASNSIQATFACPDGTAIQAIFDNDADEVMITYGDDTLTLPRAISASGARYSDDSTTFWNQGDEALLEVDGQVVVEGCVAQE